MARATLTVLALLVAGCVGPSAPEHGDPLPMEWAFAAEDCRVVGVGIEGNTTMLASRLPPDFRLNPEVAKEFAPAGYSRLLFQARRCATLTGPGGVAEDATFAEVAAWVVAPERFGPWEGTGTFFRFQVWTDDSATLSAMRAAGVAASHGTLEDSPLASGNPAGEAGTARLATDDGTYVVEYANAYGPDAHVRTALPTRAFATATAGLALWSFRTSLDGGAGPVVRFTAPPGWVQDFARTSPAYPLEGGNTNTGAFHDGVFTSPVD